MCVPLYSKKQVEWYWYGRLVNLCNLHFTDSHSSETEKANIYSAGAIVRVLKFKEVCSKCETLKTAIGLPLSGLGTKVAVKLMHNRYNTYSFHIRQCTSMSTPY